MPNTAIDAVLDAALDCEFTAAVVRVERAGDVVYERALGSVDDSRGSRTIDPQTRFDLASLTKPFVATSALECVARGLCSLDDPLVRWLPEWRGRVQAAITLRMILAHTSGMASGADYRTLRDERVEAFAIESELVAPPGERVIYSDLGFIVLGTLLSRLCGRGLAAIVGDTASRLGATTLGFVPGARERPSIPATESDAWRGRVRGSVHDEKAALMLGVAGHAGLFGTALDVAACARAFLAAIRGAPSPVDAGLARLAVAEVAFDPVLRRGLGWALKTTEDSSAGSRSSRETFGHTGFVGTSVWADPRSNISVVALTNAVFFGRRDIRALRAAIFDAAMLEYARCSSPV